MKNGMDPLKLRKMAASSLSKEAQPAADITVVMGKTTEPKPSSSEVDPEVLKAISKKDIAGTLTAGGQDIPQEWLKNTLSEKALEELQAVSNDEGKDFEMHSDMEG